MKKAIINSVITIASCLTLDLQAARYALFNSPDSDRDVAITLKRKRHRGKERETIVDVGYKLKPGEGVISGIWQAWADEVILASLHVDKFGREARTVEETWKPPLTGLRQLISVRHDGGGAFSKSNKGAKFRKLVREVKQQPKSMQKKPL